MSAITLLGMHVEPARAPRGGKRSRWRPFSPGRLLQHAGLLGAGKDGIRAEAAGAAKSVVLLYLQGGPPTQDMFDLKPEAPERHRQRIQADRHERSRHCGLRTSAAHGPLDAQDSGRSQRLPQRRLPQEPAHVHRLRRELPDEEFRESDPPSMGSVCAYQERDRRRMLPTYAYLPCPLGWGEVRKKAGPHGGFLGRRYDPFCTECTAYVDHPPDEIWRPQVVRGEPRLADMDLPGGMTLDRLQPPAAGRTIRRSVRARWKPIADLGSFPASSGWPSRCSLRPACGRHST